MAEKQIVSSADFQEAYVNVPDEDDVASDWFWISTPYPVATVLILYFMVIFKLGPAVMREREPYELKTVMRVYNIIQIILNIRLVSYAFIWHSGVSYILEVMCESPDFQSDQVKEWLTVLREMLWNYLLLKIFDLLDTVFMIMRKKNSSVTFLHVYHHAGMVFFMWVTNKYITPYHSVFPGIVNILVHTVMYTYYFLATFGPSVEKYLWWKQYLTKLQMAQFAAILVYLSSLYMNNCPVSSAFTYIWVFNVFVFLCLFLNFYVKAYLRPAQTSKTEKIS